GADVAEMGRLVRDVGAPAERLGVLIDTCHLHAAGFDLSGPEAGDRLAEALRGEGLLERLVAFHLNDCKGPVGCRRDRHEVPGEGSIGDGLVAIARHEAFRGLPGILELAVEEARRGIAYLTRQVALGEGGCSVVSTHGRARCVRRGPSWHAGPFGCLARASMRLALL